MGIKWIKLCTDIFDDEKILLIEGMPEADAIIVIWFKLLCLAGKQNNSGVFMLNDKIAYTEEMLATIFRRPLNVVRLAIKTFESFGMVEVVEGAITIPNWEKHQKLDELEAAREKNRLRVAAHREKQKQIAGCNITRNVTVTPCNALEKEIEIDKELKEKERKKEIYINNNQDTYACEDDGFKSHEEVMDEFGLSNQLKEYLKGFLRHCYLNKHIVSNDKLESIIFRLLDDLDSDKERIECIERAISGGYVDIKT